MARIKKTNNTYLGNKIALRLAYLPDAPSVFDCYGGEGLIWRIIERRLGYPIRYIAADIKDYGGGFYLPGDNLAYLGSMDLTQFNVIDLDAWGVPYKQLRTLFDRAYKGRVFVTMIQTLYGGIPHDLLGEIGFTKDMIRACPTLFSKRGWEYFKEWLALRGVRQIAHRSHAQKHYLTFQM